jgi:epoxyqueuosine reductase
MMERCQNCSVCLKSCPSGAITAERFLLHAERCIVYYNEQDADVSFPAWMGSSWHNCLVGCLRCQEVCPENKAIPEWFAEGSQFSAEETALLLEGGSRERLSAATVEKLEQWDMGGWIGIFPRNLGALLEKAQ